MSLDANTAPVHVRTPATNRLTRVRRGSLAVLALIVVEYGIGMYVNLYVAIPRADHGHGVGSAITNGPAALSVHAVIGVLLGLGALAVLAHSVMARHGAAIALSAVGLFTIAMAAALGASFTSSGDAVDSMGMSVLTGAALLCYAANLYLLPPPGQRG